MKILKDSVFGSVEHVLYELEDTKQNEWNYWENKRIYEYNHRPWICTCLPSIPETDAFNNRVSVEITLAAVRAITVPLREVRKTLDWAENELNILKNNQQIYIDKKEQEIRAKENEMQKLREKQAELSRTQTDLVHNTKLLIEAQEQRKKKQNDLNNKSGEKDRATSTALTNYKPTQWNLSKYA